MKNKQIIGLVVAGAVFIVTGVTSVLTNTLSANTMAEDVTRCWLGNWNLIRRQMIILEL